MSCVAALVLLSCIDPQCHLVQLVAINLVSHAWLRRRVHVSILCDSDAVLYVCTVTEALRKSQLKPGVIRHGEFAMEMHRMVVSVAPVVGLALHVEGFRELGDFHPAADATDIVYDEL